MCCLRSIQLDYKAAALLCRLLDETSHVLREELSGGHPEILVPLPVFVLGTGLCSQIGTQSFDMLVASQPVLDKAPGSINDLRACLF